jgi:hypothetical protein
MKNMYFVIAFLAACHARAQYTLTAGSNPVAGDVYRYCFMYTTGVTGGSSGTAQVWDYSDLVAYPSGRVTKTYTTAASTPSASLFPSANMASETDRSPGSFEYYHISATEKSLVGKILYNSNSSTGGSLIMRFANPVVFSALPFSYGSSAVSNNFTGSNTNSVGSVNYSGEMTIKAEGTGMLILPDGQIYSNVLKIETVETYTLNGSDTVTTTTINEWYSAASKFPLLHVLSFVTGNGSGTFVNTEVKMNTGIDVGLREPADTKPEFSIYPNPSQTEVFVDFEAIPEKSYSFDIIDLRGRIVKQASFRSVNNGKQHHHIDLSGLSAGTYVAKLRGDGKEGSRQLIIE